MTTKIISIVFLAAALAAFSSCARNDKDSDDEGSGAPVPPAAAAVEVTTAPVETGTIVNTLRVTGTTEALHEEQIATPIAGRIVALNVIEGDVVRAGESLAVVRTQESEAALTGAESALAGASTPRQKREAAQALALARASANDLPIRAPFAGAVAARAVNDGQFVAANAQLLTIVDLSSLYFLADIPAASLSAIHTGETAVIAFPGFPGTTFGARVAAINPQVDAASQMAKARLRFTGDFRALRGDMNGEARIVIGEHGNAVLVPRRAVLMDNETGAAYIVAARDSLAHIVPVRLGLADSARDEILSPALAPGAQVIVEGNYGLKDSTRIVVIRRTGAAP